MKLRSLLQVPGTLVAPAVGHALDAKLVEYAGFDVAYVSGFAVSWSMGLPDIGLLTLSEMVAHGTSIAAAVEIPVFCDSETGFGNHLNVRRAVREFERGGIAGIVIGDRSAGAGRGPAHPLATVKEMVGKLRAALDSRKSSEFAVIAATHADAEPRMSRLYDRCRAYQAAGADSVLIAQPINGQVKVERMPRRLSALSESLDIPLMAVMPHPPVLSVEDLGAAGAKVVIVSPAIQLAAAGAIFELLTELRRVGSIERLMDVMVKTQFVTNLLGLPRVRDLDRQFAGVPSGAWTPW